MCESSVFIRKEKEDKLLVEDVARVVPEGDEVKILTLLGEEYKVKGQILEIDLLAHRIVVLEN